MTNRTMKIKGMSCGHCVAAVTKALGGVEGVSNVQVDLERGLATFDEEAPVDPKVIEQYLEEAGYSVG